MVLASGFPGLILTRLESCPLSLNDRLQQVTRAHAGSACDEHVIRLLEPASQRGDVLVEARETSDLAVHDTRSEEGAQLVWHDTEV